MVIMMVGVIIIELDYDLGFQKYIILGCSVKNCFQEPSLTWRTSFILLRFLMVIMIVGSWGLLPLTGFCLRFPKIYNTWGDK